jgi:hypothetical protein
MRMPRFLIHHRHEPEECGVVFASFKGDASPHRGKAMFATCLAGGHEIWWVVDAADQEDALAQLPYFVARRSTAVEITEVRIP